MAGASLRLVDIRFYTLRHLRPRLVVRDTRGWGESQAGDIRFYTCGTCASGLVRLGVRLGWGESQAGLAQVR